MKRLFFRNTILLLILLGPSITYSGGRMTYSETSEPQTLNPLNMTDVISFRFLNLLYNNLIGVDINMLPNPELLKSLEPIKVSEDGLTYTFLLKDNVKWHDGTSLTAKDVEFTFKMLKDERTGTNKGWVSDVFSKVNAIDEHTIEFTLRRKMPKEMVLGKLFWPIIPHHIFNPTQEYISLEDEFGRTKVIGSGPYSFKSWIEGKGILLKQNKGYFKKWRKLGPDEKRIEEIVMKYIRDPRVAIDSLLMGSGVDLIPVVRPVDYNEVRNDPYCDLVKYNSRSFAYFAYNCNHPFLKDSQVRQALTYAVDREEMLSKIYGKGYVDRSQIMSGPYPPGEDTPEVKSIPYDLDKAKKLLSAAGFKDTNGDGILEKDGKPFIVSLKTYVKDESFRRICTLYQAQLLKIGIKLKGEQIEFMEMNKWIKQVCKDKNFDITFGSWSFHEDTDIVDDLFSAASMRPGGNNFVSYTNPKVESLLKINRTVFDPEIRRKNKYELHKIIAEDCPYTFLFILPAYAGVRTSSLKGVDIHPYYFFNFITNWYLTEVEF